MVEARLSRLRTAPGRWGEQEAMPLDDDHDDDDDDDDDENGDDDDDDNGDDDDDGSMSVVFTGG